MWLTSAFERTYNQLVGVFVALDDTRIFKPICEEKRQKGSPYSISERRVPELIPVLGSQLQVT